jgi:hypothetical protein
MKRLMIALTLAAVAAFPAAAPAEAKQAKVNICHVSDEDFEYHAIRVAERSFLKGGHGKHFVLVNGVEYHDYLLAEGAVCTDIPEPEA